MARRAAVASAVVLLFAVAGCGASTGSGGTDLTMVALNQNVGRAVFHLQCDPSGGDFPDSAAACAALDSNPELLTDPEPFTCAGGTSSWWDVTVTGHIDEESLHRGFSTCWTPQMETLERLGLTWESLESHLVPRGEEALLPGETRHFPSGVLSATDLVTCDILGHHLEVGVPWRRMDSRRARATTGPT